MSKTGNIPTIEVDARDKGLYKNFMCGKTDVLEHKDKIFTFTSKGSTRAKKDS